MIMVLPQFARGWLVRLALDRGDVGMVARLGAFL
jgi:hypothetical protein